jgi:hypothetical protein
MNTDIRINFLSVFIRVHLWLISCQKPNRKSNRGRNLELVIKEPDTSVSCQIIIVSLMSRYVSSYEEVRTLSVCATERYILLPYLDVHLCQ